MHYRLYCIQKTGYHGRISSRSYIRGIMKKLHNISNINRFAIKKKENQRRKRRGKEKRSPHQCALAGSGLAVQNPAISFISTRDFSLSCASSLFSASMGIPLSSW